MPKINFSQNIAYTTTAIADVPGSGIQMGIQMGVYRYDQMNRLVGARTFRASGLAASNSWTGAAETQEYKSTYSYDANGNLTHLQRNGGAANLNMDKFDYEFETVSGFASNRLDYVKDDASYSANYAEDLDNQNPDNYGYDKLGQLIRDNSEGLMTIEWFSGNRKVKKITRSGKTIEFKYNPFGQRLLKTVTNTSTGAVTTSYYAYDANGQVMGVYEVNPTTNKVTLNELNIYGASRLGMIDRDDLNLVLNGVEQPAPVYPPVNPAIHTLGYKKYEIVNYLGNVNAVITDRKVYTGGTYEAVVIMNSDYYPFGMQMPERHTNEQNYRFGYNGMELDNEAKGNGNSYTTEFRQYDPRLGHWLSLDPLMAQFPWMSPYVAFDNNPIYFTDPLGLAAEGGPDEPTPSSKGLPSNPVVGQTYEADNGNSYTYDGERWSSTIAGETSGATAKRPSEASIKAARIRHEAEIVEFWKNKEIEKRNSSSIMGGFFSNTRGPNLTTRPHTPPNTPKFADPIDCLLAFEGLSVGGAIVAFVTIETGGLALEFVLPALSSTSVGVSTTTGMLTETSIFSSSSIVNVGSGSMTTFLGTAAVKSALDMSAQAVVVGPENIDVADGLASGILTPGWAAVTGATIDYRPASNKNNLRIVGWNKNMKDAFIDGSLKYTFGAKGPIGSYPKQVSDKIVKLGGPQLAPVFNAPVSLSGKIAGYKIKKLF